MPFISPMLASGEPKKNWDPVGYWMETKYDGHRLIVEVTWTGVQAWGRYGIERKLPEKFQALGEYLGPGIYDGELIVPGQQSHNVVELTKREDLVFMAFDILQEDGLNMMDAEWEFRRVVLKDNFKPGGPVQLTDPQLITCRDDVDEAYDKIIREGGEGLILKNPNCEYLPGKRPKDHWIKMKAVRTAVMEILGFAPGRNGPFSKAVLEGDDLKRTTVKVLNDALLAEVHQNPQKFIGRRLRIEYNERYANGSYRHPRWDHLLEDGDD